MRVLSNHEANRVTGAGYREDIVMVAATFTAANGIGNLAAQFIGAAFAGTALLLSPVSSLQPAVRGLNISGPIAAKFSYFAAPVLFFDITYPGVMAKQIESFFK